MNSNLVSKAVRFALVAGAAITFSAPAVFAQNAPTAGTSAAPPAAAGNQNSVQLGRISVTGTAIPRTNTETPSPVTVITAKEIKESGLTTIADVIRSIAADNSGTIPTAFTGGFAGGSSGVALRGLTVNSTLVLIDGHRTAAYPLADDGIRSFTDLNSIPLNAVERIEVLKDGASSIYGADAIGGVVNIILYHSYQGSEATAQVGTSQHGGGTQTEATVITGTGDLAQNHYNAYVDFEYEMDQPIYNHERGFPFNTADLTPVGGIYLQAGNPALESGSAYGTVAPATLGTPGDLLTGTQIPNTQYQPLRACGSDTTPVTSAAGTYCGYNNAVSEFGQIAPQVTRYGIDGRVTVQLNDANQASLNASFNQVRVVTGFGGLGPQIQTTVPTNTTAIALPPTLANGQLNPNDPFAAQGQYALINYAFGDLPGFGALDSVNHVVRVVGDVNGALSENWNYDAALTISNSWLNYDLHGFLYYPQLITDINDGAYSFVNPASNSQAVRDALAPVNHKNSTTTLDEFDYGINGEVGNLPGGPLGVAVGTQWRYEAQDDPDLNPGNNFQGLGSAHTRGQRNVAALYGELDAPLLSSLEVDVSAREDHYSDFGSAFSPKVGFKWTPISEFGVRGTYSKGFRAPAFAENGSSGSLGFTPGYQPPPAFIAAHNNDGYVQPYSLGISTTGNPNIQPERARNYTFGFIFQPAQGFSGTLDYYNILKTNLIAGENASPALNAYYAGQPIPPGFTVTPDLPDPLFPNLLPRPASYGGEYTNGNELRTTGADLNLSYNLNFASGLTWTSQFNVTQIFQWEVTLIQGGPFVSMVGTQGPFNLSSGAGTPRTRANWSNSFNFGPATITGTFYYTSGLYMSAPDITGTNQCFSTATPTGVDLPADCRVPSFTYIDLTGAYKFNSNWTLTAGILNVFDRKAPFDPIDYAGNNYNPTYAYSGIVGRFFQIGASVKF